MMFVVLALLAFGRPARAEFEISTGRDFVAAVANPSLAHALLVADIVLREEDFEGYELPIRVTRDFTVTGVGGQPLSPAASESAAVNGNIGSIQLGRGVSIGVSNVLLVNWFTGNYEIAPHIEMLTPMPPGESASAFAYNSFLPIAFCWPPDVQVQGVDVTPRPPWMPGTQKLTILPPAPGCVNISSLADAGGDAEAVLLEQRCWVQQGNLDDLALHANEIDANSQKQIPLGYGVHLRNTSYGCYEEMTQQCIEDLGTFGCINSYAYGALPPPPRARSSSRPPPLSAVAAQPQAPAAVSSGGGGGGVPMGAVVGGAAGGGAALAAVAALIVWRKRQQRMRMPKRGDQKESCENGAGAASSSDLDERNADAQDTAGGGGTGEEAGRVAVGNAANSSSGPASASEGGSWYTAATRSAASGSAGGPVAVLRLTHVSSSGPSSLAGGGTTSGAGPSLADGCSPLLGSATPFPATSMGPAAAPRGGRPPADPLAVLSPLTPPRPDVRRLDSAAAAGPAAEVALLPGVLGKGAFGRVVEGRYQGRLVAVKLLLDDAMGVWGLKTGQQLAAAGALGGTVGSAATDGGNGAAMAAAGGKAQQQQLSRGNVVSDTAAWLMEALTQEVEVLGRCQHPNVVTLLAACLTPPRVCLVLERCDTSLDKLLYGSAPPGGLLPMDQVLSIALDIARGLEYLHPTVVHRDLKPGNVLVNNPGTPQMVAKLSDFGLSRLRTTVAAVTQNVEVGTPEFMAPELYSVTNNVVTHKVDVYSFGVLLWAMLSGKRPWEGLQMVIIAVRVTMLKARPPLEDVPPDRLPPKLARLLRGCWDGEPERRPAAAELVKELLLVQEQRSLAAAAEA
ncbi:hypothetical protein GPECTOR_47g398 [Gonium pectorale]|uniref:Protein kinase domain-containing protein n=1 Tax=Gonium pectorale TaxID=33097 RepID=A0A150G9U8_GONPE|nr:hypothetical protein GPECTOR_47g398 [Gonium pectorale]|eukprot:KXZ46120.1 hypothetical protein GPECTOR_47g398 [Gonium pectorale]